MKTIETQVDIRSDAQTVWNILTDFSTYGTWNPFIPQICGEARPGGRLKVRMQPPGGRETCFRPRILRCRPLRELSWVGRMMLPGLLDGTHTFRISPTGAGVRLYHEERLSGIASPLFSEPEVSAIRAGFELMNERLRSRAEALYAEATRAA